ncbi:tRNA lysidine(34) synthetase TilS [Luteimonas sp. SJ-92]|uniref:tRNA(Ile)-lysidine synthase n=1 Tax=Luteimonas salinisoli TaxID=2752307 RepID=A0A853JGR6_9GAMM|nr:tRNA lysidine(34) synthetase TilS [Luteimonas salinisoli]NZA28055.1 tRNA lysidine(34) synthetase TilS [Luteimonas salinisoli]
MRISTLQAQLSRYAHLAEAHPLLIGYSGGVDSTVLLHALLESRAPGRSRGLRAIHVHHGLQPEADAWAAHCRRTCDALGVPLRIVRVDVRSDTGTGPEAAARAARHAAFEAELEPGEVLALAHHRDDQAETFLLRALRGAGADGLGAMAPWRRHGRGWLWRPLLGVARAELLAEARARGLEWIEDPANAESRHDRNFLRHQVLPLLQQRWPHAHAAFAESARLSAEACALLGEEDALALAMARTADPQALSVARLLQLPEPRRARVLRLWVGAAGLPPLPARGVRQIEAQLLHAGVDRIPAFAWHGAELRRWRGQLHADWQRPALPADLDLAWKAPYAPLPLPGGGRLAFDPPIHGHADAPADEAPAGASLGSTLRVRARRGGERIRLPGRRHSHSLKHVLQALGVPPWVRERMPLLVNDDGSVLAAGCVAVSASLDAWLRVRRLRLAWSPDPDPDTD